MAGKYRDPKSGAWYLSWYEDGRLIRRSLGKITEAEAEAARLAREQAGRAAPAAGPCLSAWAERYAAWHAQEYPDSYFRVEQILRTHLLPAFGAIPLLALGREAVEHYKHARAAAGAATGTIVKELRTLQAMLNHAVAWEVIPRNPIAGVKAPRDLASRPPRWYTADELQRLYQVESDPPPCITETERDLHRQYRWTWQLLANSGIRRGEALALRWADVGREELRILSEPGARTKSGKWRAIPISAGAEESLASLRAGTPRAFVVPQVNPVSLSRAFARTLGRTGLDGGLHCLRHTYCSHLVQSGVPLRTVQVLAGHSSIRITENYAHLAPSTLRDAVLGLRI